MRPIDYEELVFGAGLTAAFLQLLIAQFSLEYAFLMQMADPVADGRGVFSKDSQIELRHCLIALPGYISD
jgi:hypothetical protein